MFNDEPREAKAGGNGTLAGDQARPSFILDTNVLVADLVEVIPLGSAA